MDQVFIEMLKQAPSLGVLCALVYVFLRHLEAEGKANRAIHQKHSEAIDGHTQAITELRISLIKAHVIGNGTGQSGDS